MKPKNSIYKRAIDKFGELKQYDILIEECSELIHAICKCKRYNKFSGLLFHDFIDEMADVQIMINQFKEIYGELLEESVNRKLVKLERILQEEDR